MARMLNNKNLNYKKKLGDQKCIFGLQTRSLREGGGKKEGEEEKEEEEEGGEQIQGMDACLWYGTCDFYMELYGFIWISCLIVWLGACSKPRIVRITS